MSNGLSAGEKLLSHAAHALEHHPKKFTAFLAAMLLGAGGGAFAVASYQPADAHVTVRQVVEAVTPLAIDPQGQALDRETIGLFRTELTRASDTTETLLSRLGIDDDEAAAFLRRDPVFRMQLLARDGRLATAESSADRRLRRLIARWTPENNGTFRRLVVDRNAEGRLAARVETAPLVPSLRVGTAVLRTSLFSAADEAGIPDPVITQLVEIFSGDIDFHRDLRRGDRLNVVYETLEADGEALRTGKILSVEFVNQGVAHEAVWFQEPGKKGGYYDFDGDSLETSYLASPMQFSRVSSSFKMRMHPIQHVWKAHLGVDYAANIGTPVRTVGGGTVDFAGEQNGFGRVVIVRHNASEQTVYAHLSRIGVRAGQPVEQGQTIGLVGQTGWATGPHLHFEFRVNGIHRNPSTMARHSTPPISATARADFDRVMRGMRAQLAAAAQAGVQLARAN